MGKRALVTGGARGIGAEITRALAEAGWSVVIHYHTSKERAMALAEETGGTPIRADVRDFGEVNEMFTAAGPVDLWVNNAGIANYGLFTDMNLVQWRDLFAVNVDGVFHCTQCALPYMLREKQGTIINISSAWGITGASCEAAYAATKAAVIGLTKSLAQELGPSGIRINCIAPGPVDTDMLSHLSPSDREEVRLASPLGKIATPQDIAPLVVFLASPAAKLITGATLRI